MRETLKNIRVGKALLHLTFIMGAGLFVEVFTAMSPLLHSGGNIWAWLPVVFLPVAVALTILAQLSTHDDVLRGFQVAMGLAIAVGLLGTAFHLAAHGLFGPALAHPLSFSNWSGQPPIFAPMSFGVLGVLGWFAIVQTQGSACSDGWSAILAGASGALSLSGMILDIFGLARGVGVLLILAGTGLQAVGLGVEWFLPGGRVQSRAARDRHRTDNPLSLS